MSDLANTATRGMFWSLAENLGLHGVQLAISIILARLLLPEQFGLIGMLTLFMALAQSLLDSGFGSALIQKQEANTADKSSVFWLNLILGVMLTVLLIATAPLIARFYGAPALVPLTRFLALNIFLNAFALVPSALLTRRLDFKGLLKASLVSTVVGGVVGVSLALRGMGVWSLAVQSVLSTLLRSVLLSSLSHWRPSRVFSFPALRAMFSYGSRMMLSGLLDAFFQNLYQPLIGKVYTSADVGYYGRAQSLQAAAVQPSGSALGRVIFPALAPIQEDRARLKKAVEKTIDTTVFFHFPFMIGLAAIASPLIRLLLTDRWAPSIPYFQLFCVAGLLYPLHVINLTVLKATGRSDLFFRLEILKKLLVVANLVITFRWGITALLYGQVVTSVLGYVLNSYYSGRLIDYPIAEQFRTFYPQMLMSLLVGAAMYAVGRIVRPELVAVLAGALAGLLLYVGLNYALRRGTIVAVLGLAREVVSPFGSR